ncbi:1-aminocyclopropane-1-carboxylate synthase 4-like [Dorcoceras hygrometricum]|uniref:1-aminocyclopropane-1-carboxylate synthase 4-like n=1 Tax=Dorcoceras hygrometricum TaxID=472368 RepID=A0A2Z7C7K6_9LAMI|nr:1-aminocyclopropane-1-carboxylate synthase 4-like [Dorcoceras hygrometricum]
MTRSETPSSACTRRTDEISTNGFSSSNWPKTIFRRRRAAAAAACREEGGRRPMLGIQLAVGPQPLRLRNQNSGVAHRIMVKRLATSPHDPLGITDSACKNQLVVVSVQYGPFNQYIPIRSTTIGKSRVAIDPIAMPTSWRSNSDIANNIGYPRMSASGESSTTIHRLLHASGSHPIPTPYDPMAFRQLPCWRLGAWLRPVSRGNRHFTVGGGRLRQSGPRLEGRLLRQPALEGLTRSARMDSSRKVGRKKFRRGAAAAAFWETREACVRFRVRV